MKLIVRQLVDALPALQALVATKMKVGPSFWVSRQGRAIDEALKDYHAQRVNLVRQHGVVNPKDDSAHVEPGMPGWLPFTVELDELLAEEIEIGLEVRPVTVLGEIDVAPNVLMALHFLFKDESA